MSRKAFLAAPIAVALLLSAPALAQQSQDQAPPPTIEDQMSEAEKQLEAAVQLMLGALRGIIGSIPQYHMPEVLENGDIIIRRVQPDDPPAGKGETKEGDGGVKL